MINKERADKIIISYMKKIYGFARTKTLDIDTAEDLASRIMLEVYKALLKAETIFNINSYIFRIANNVYSRFILEEKNRVNLLDGDFEMFYEPSVFNSEMQERIRNEIAYLSNLQREIIILHYYEKLKLSEIAKKLNLPSGTIRWHLFEAKSNIKDGFTNKRIKSESSKKVIFSDLIFLGRIGFQSIDISEFLSKSIPQNIVYSVYREAKTASDIAKELDIPVAFIEDEITHLLENGFLKNMPSNKYLTNIYIIERIKENEQVIEKYLSKIIIKICDKYIHQLFKAFKPSQMDEIRDKIYIPQNDYNFFMWSLVSYACGKVFEITDRNTELAKFAIKRNDGGKNIAIAMINDSLKSLESYNNTFFEMVSDFVTANNNRVKIWQFYSPYDNRDHKYTDWTNLIFEYFYTYLGNKLPKIPENIDVYKKLFDKGYLVSKGNSEYVNMVVSNLSEAAFFKMIPAVPDEFKSISAQLDEDFFNIKKSSFPPHLQNLCKAMNKNIMASGLVRMKILDYLLKRGILKPLKKHQKKTVNMIMFNDIIPL